MAGIIDFFWPSVKRMRKKGDVEGLVALCIRGDFFDVNAAKALAEMKDPKAIEFIIQALKFKSDHIRRNAVKALAEIAEIIDTNELKKEWKCI